MSRLPLTRTELEIRIKKYPSNIEQYGDINNWNVSNITDMSNLFMYSNSFNEDISEWDVSKVTNMSGMFKGATSFNQPLNKWDVSKVTNMSHMFEGASSFNQPLGYVDDANPGWDVSNVTNMSHMFKGASSFNQPLNNWNVSKVTEMSFMFYNAESFNQPLYNWNIKKVRNLTRFTNTREYHETGRAHVKEGRILLGPHFKYININRDFNLAYNLWLKQLFIMLLYQMKLNVKNTKLNNIDNIDNSTNFDNVKNITIEECLTLPKNLNILNILLPYIECFSTGPTIDKIPNGLKNFLYYVEDIHYFHDNDIEMPDGFEMVNSKEGFELIKKDLENIKQYIKQYNNEIIGAEEVAKKIYSKSGQDMYNNIVHFIPGTQTNKFYTINYKSKMNNLGHNSESISNTQIQPIIPNTQPVQRNSRPTRQSTRRNTTSTTQPPVRRNTTSTTQQSTRRNTTSTTQPPVRRNTTSTTQQSTRRNTTSTTQPPIRRNTTSTTQPPVRRNTTSTTQQSTRRNTRERNNRILQNNWMERISEPNQPRERDEYEIGEDGYEIEDE